MRRVRVALLLASILLIFPMINIVATPQTNEFDYGSETGTYQWTFDGPEQSSGDDHGDNFGDATAVNPMAGPHYGEIEEDGDEDYFTFFLTNDWIDISIEVQLGTLDDSELYLYSSDETEIAYNDDDDGLASAIQLSLLESGTYYVRISGYMDSETGTYQWTFDGTEQSSGGNNGDIPINSEGTLDQYNAGNSNEYIIDIDSYTNTWYGDTWSGGINAIYTIGGSNPRICTISLASDAWEFDTQSETCVSGQYSHVDVALLGAIYSVQNDRTLRGTDFWSASNSLADFEDIYTFSSDITAILDVSYSSGLVAVATEDGKLRLVDISGSDGVVDTMTPVSSSIYITTLDNDPTLQIGNKFYAGFSDGSIIDFEIDSDGYGENIELVKGEREITSGGSINAISVMSLMSLDPDITDLIYSDGSMANGLHSSDYSLLWSENGGRSSSITDLADSLACYAYIAHEEGSVSEIGTCDSDSSNLYNNTALHDFTSSYSGSCGCSKVVGIDMHYRSFFATAGSSLYIIYREPADGGEENEEGPGGDVSVFGDYILQLPNHSWKNGLLCRVEVLCFQKMVNSADDSDKLTYIDQEVIVTIFNTDGTESVNAIITDENGAIVLRQPMTCTFVGGSSTCTGDIAIETQEVKAYFDETIGNIVHDGLAEFFKNEAVGRTTSILVIIAIPVICIVVGILSAFLIGPAAIPVGVGCVHALWALYKLVKSITFLLSLVTYYNIVDDNLGSYENKVFPNRYVSAIEVNGVTHDIVDLRLDRLNDVSETELQALGNHDSLEFIGLSPIDFQLSRNGATLTDDEDLLRISGDSAFEMMLVIDPENNDAVIVEGTGDGTYSIIGIYNDADISSTDSGDEEAPFATAFLIEKDTQISNGETVTYLDYDYWSWDDEAKLQDDGEVNSDDVGAKDPERESVWNVLAPLLLLSGIIAAVVVIIRKRRGKSTPTITPSFVTEQQAPIVPNQPQIPQPLHAHEVISPSPQQNQFVAPAPVYDPIPSVEQQWVDDQGRTCRRLNNGCTQMWNGTDWQNI